MRKYFILPIFLTFLFYMGSPCVVRSVFAQDENIQEIAINLDQINVFDDKESQLLDSKWQAVEFELAKLEKAIKSTSQVKADKSESSAQEEKIEGQIEEKVVEQSETESQKVQPDETQPQEIVDDGTRGELKKASDSVELNGDVVDYSMDGNKVTATGNVVVINKDMDLTCDRIEFSRDTNMAYATGNVRLVMKKEGASEMTGEKLTFNFKTMRGNFDGAKIYAKPYYGYGEKVFKAGENHMKMEKTYVTTCDLDKPHYRLASKKMDIYPGDKMVARNVRMLIGNLPMMYIPKFSQDLSSKEPLVTFTPGSDKEWGMFLLSSWRYKLNENFKGIIHVDARERKDLAWGVDLDYETPKYGEGRVWTYYMNERNITSKRFYQERPSPTIERERFGVEWRHKWEMDSKTDMVLQYAKLGDGTFLKDYFKRRYEEDSSPKTFFLLTRTLPKGTLSYRTDIRVNRFVSAVERLPEIRYNLPNYEVLNSGFYLHNSTTYSNLTNKTASPSEVRKNTMRVDTDSSISYPMKVGIFELSPSVGGRNTYYSKTKNRDDYGTVRGIFHTGASLSTRFYKVFGTQIQKFGLNINRLRHIITPTAAYTYATLPTTTSDQLDIFDGVDSLNNVHSINFSLENKLQTKRNKQTVELLRAVIGTNFRLKEHPSKGGFDQITTDIDFRPVDWVTFYFDSNYDTRRDFLTTANFDAYINGGEKWSVSIGKRWNRNVDDQLTTSFNYKLNPKWGFRTYTRFDLRSGILKEQEFSVTRDLHAWKLDINFNETRKQGNEIWMVFTLKAFPDMVIDFGTSFNKRKPGSQSSAGD